MDKNAISHSVDMARGCHSAYGLMTSLCHIHLMGYCVFLHQPRGLAFIPQVASKVLNGHIMSAVIPCKDPLNIHRNIQWLVFH